MSAVEKLGRQFFTPTGNITPEEHARGFREYTVGSRKGKTEMTHGRVARMGTTSWTALGVGTDSWTGYHPTRQAALDEMYRMQGRG